MRNRSALLVVLMLLPLAQGQFVEPLPYSSSTEYTGSFEGLPALISGSMTYNATAVRNTTMVFGTNGTDISGLEEVCWQDDQGDYQCERSDNLVVRVLQDGSFAFRSPVPYAIDADAAHALAFFADASQMFGDNPEGGERQEDLELGPALVAIPTDETIRIHDVAYVAPPSFSSASSFNDLVDELALVLALSDNTTLVILDGNDEVDRLQGSGRFVGVIGNPEFTPITAGMAVLPMPDGASAQFARADDDAAQRGLSGENLASAFGSMQAAEGSEDADATSGISDITETLSGFLNGAYVDLSAVLGGLDEGGETGNATEEDQGALLTSITLVRFESMEVARAEDQVEFDGAAPLQIQEGEVAGATPLKGGFIPVMGIVLWVAAIALLVARFILHPPKENKLWDNLHWIGRIASPLALIIVFIIWDRAMASLWGVSILSSNVSGVSMGVIVALELVPLLLAGLYFGLPTRILVSSATRFAGQGRMMNIGGVIAPFVMLLLGIPLMLSLIQSGLSLAGGG